MSEAKERLDRLRAKRGGHRGVCTKLAKEALEATTTVENGDVDRSEIIRGLLQERMKTINDIDEEILGLCDVKDIEHEIEESAEVAARILNAIKVIDKFIKGQTNETIHGNSLSAASQDDVNTSNTNSPTENTSDNNASASVATSVSESINTSTVTNSTTSTNTSPKTKLPKLSLAKFKGQVTKWNTFWDSFESAVHNNQEISKVDKFNYLTSLLEGTALRAIQGLTLTGANYDAAIEILRDRFGRPQQIITAHMDELLKLPACTGDRLSSLRFVYDQISVHVRGLASLGVSSEQYGSLLIPIIMSKMPTDIRLEIARKATKDVWKIDDLLSTIKFEIEAREVSEGTKSSEKALPRTGYGSKREDGLRNQSTANSLLAGAKDGEFEARNSKGMTGQGQSQTGFKIQCAFCNGLHYSASCDKVVTANERKAILKKAGRCFRCLYRGHHVRDCKGPRNC